MAAAGSGVSVGMDPVAAAESAAELALASLQARASGGSGGRPIRPDAALVVSTAAWGQQTPRLVDAAAAALGTPELSGASVFGVLHGGEELEQNPAVAVLALSGVEAIPFLLEAVVGDEARAGEEICDLLAGGPRPEDLVVLFPDAHSVMSEPLLAGLRKELSPAQIVGVAASEVPGGRPWLWGGGRVVSGGGVAGLALRLVEAPRVELAQGARLASPPMVVTRAEGNWVYALDGRKALQVYREVAREPLAADLHRAARSLVVALPGGPTQGRRGLPTTALSLATARLRGVAGFDLAREGFSLPEPVAAGEVLALAFLDAHSARENLTAAVDQLGDREPSFGLYLGCRTRGASLFGLAGLEAGYLERVRAPILGVTGPYQIASLGASARPELLTHAGVLALIDSA